MILRLVAAFLVNTYDIEFAPGEKPSTIVEESSNTVTNNPGPLRLVFRKRHVFEEKGSE